MKIFKIIKRKFQLKKLNKKIDKAVEDIQAFSGQYKNAVKLGKINEYIISINQANDCLREAIHKRKVLERWLKIYNKKLGKKKNFF